MVSGTSEVEKDNPAPSILENDPTTSIRPTARLPELPAEKNNTN